MSSSNARACLRTSTWLPRANAPHAFALAALLLAAGDAGATGVRPLGQGGFTVGGTVTGLVGTDMVLALNGGSPLLVGSNGPFTFAPVLAGGAAYSVTIVQQPIEPNQVCTVQNGDGTIAGANVTDVVVDCAVPAPHLSLDVSDDHEYGRYGLVTRYVVTLTNDGTGDASGVSIAAAASAQFDAAQSSWTCVGAGAGASCTAEGTGALADSGIALPAGRSLSWLVDARVQPDAAGIVLDYTVNASGAGEASATDEDVLVILRTGTDVPYGDGAE